MLDKYDKFSKCLVERIPFINPFHKTKLFWDILILFTIVWFFFLIPLQLSFGFQFNLDFYKFLESSNLDYNLIKFLVFIPEILLVIDSLLKFITGYHKNGILIIDHEKIIHHYIKKGLLMDILSYLPLVTLAFRPDSGIFLQMMQLFLFLKLNRVKIIINNFKDMILLNGKQDYILSIIILIFQLVFFSHIVACIWHSIAYYYPIENTPTWLDFYDIKSFSWSTKYYHSLFWSVSMMVTVGFGEKVSPRNNLELVVGVWILLISSLLLGYTINAIGSILTEMSRNEIEYK